MRPISASVAPAILRSVIPLTIPIQRMLAPALRTRSETARVSSKTIGGTDGKTYPGSLDFEMLKKTRVRTAQQANRSAGELRHRLSFHARQASEQAAASKGAQGNSAKNVMGT